MSFECQHKPTDKIKCVFIMNVSDVVITESKEAGKIDLRIKRKYGKFTRPITKHEPNAGR